MRVQRIACYHHIVAYVVYYYRLNESVLEVTFRREAFDKQADYSQGSAFLCLKFSELDLFDL